MSNVAYGYLANGATIKGNVLEKTEGCFVLSNVILEHNGTIKKIPSKRFNPDEFSKFFVCKSKESKPISGPNLKNKSERTNFFSQAVYEAIYGCLDSVLSADEKERSQLAHHITISVMSSSDIKKL